MHNTQKTFLKYGDVIKRRRAKHKLFSRRWKYWDRIACKLFMKLKKETEHDRANQAK